MFLVLMSSLLYSPKSPGGCLHFWESHPLVFGTFAHSLPTEENIVATVRYLVNDVERAIDFYTRNLEFKLDQSMAPAFARISKDDLTLWLAGPKSSAARPMPDGRQPEPGGWNRFVLEIAELEPLVAKLKQEGIRFRNDVVTGPGGKQILLEDPDGNVVELFEAAR